MNETVRRVLSAGAHAAAGRASLLEKYTETENTEKQRIKVSQYTNYERRSSVQRVRMCGCVCVCVCVCVFPPLQNKEVEKCVTSLFGSLGVIMMDFFIFPARASRTSDETQLSRGPRDRSVNTKRRSVINPN